MNNKRIKCLQQLKLTVIFFMIMTVIACATVSNDTVSVENMCSTPRPEICTADYVPVCGVHVDGTKKTYSNGCSACSKKEVVGYTSGKCH